MASMANCEPDNPNGPFASAGTTAGFDLRTAVAVSVGTTFALLAGYAIILRVAVEDSAERGQFGDMFGGATALFSALAFVAVVLSLLLQRQELSLQRQELAQQRQELAKMHEVQRTAYEHERSIAQSRKQSATIEMAAPISASVRGVFDMVEAELGDRSALASDVDLSAISPALRDAIRNHLNKVERLSVAATLGIVDMETIELVIGSIVIATPESFSGYMAAVRQSRSNTTYGELERLAAEIDAFRFARLGNDSE